MKSSIPFVLFFVVLVLAGCSKRPAGMPATFPCKITIVSGGIPKADHEVALHLVTGNGALSIMANTDSSGIAEIRTRLADYTAKGAPEGTFKVTVERHVHLPDDGVDLSRLSRDEVGAYLNRRAAEGEKLREFPVQLSRSESTPFEITVAKGGENQWTFDLKDYSK